MKKPAFNTLKRHFDVLYWGYNQRDPSTLTELSRTAAIPDDTMAVLTASGDHPITLHFIVDDGLDWFLPVDNLCEIREIIDNVNV